MLKARHFLLMTVVLIGLLLLKKKAFIEDLHLWIMFCSEKKKPGDMHCSSRITKVSSFGLVVASRSVNPFTLLSLVFLQIF